jgi:hypothetical protein
MIVINLTQVRELIEMFGGEEAEIAVDYIERGYAGDGLYAWHVDYEDEGSTLLGDADAPPPPEGTKPRPSPTKRLLKILSSWEWACVKQREVEPGLWRDCGGCPDCKVREAIRDLG